jgi:hypothetical protein
MSQDIWQLDLLQLYFMTDISSEYDREKMHTSN